MPSYCNADPDELLQAAHIKTSTAVALLKEGSDALPRHDLRPSSACDSHGWLIGCSIGCEQWWLLCRLQAATTKPAGGSRRDQLHIVASVVLGYGVHPGVLLSVVGFNKTKPLEDSWSFASIPADISKPARIREAWLAAFIVCLGFAVLINEWLTTRAQAVF